MTELGDLLELLHGSRSRFETVRASVRTWRHHARFARALERTGAVSYAPLDDSRPEAYESVARVWLAPPDRAREEHDGPEGHCLAVQRGASWWRYDPTNGALSNEGDPDTEGGVGEALQPLLDASATIGLLDFEPLEPGGRAGRRTVRVRAVPRKVSRAFGLMPVHAEGADELLLDVDAERGLPLRIEASLAGEPFSIVEVLEVAFDETFSDETFTFTPPRGVPVRTTFESEPVRFGLTVEQAARAAPFTLWIPDDGWDDVEVVFVREEEDPPTAPQVHLQYIPAGLRIVQSPASHAGAMAEIELAGAGPWRASERGGRRIEVRQHAEYRLPSQLRLELEGTRVLIHSPVYGPDALVDVAAGLRRA